MDRGHGEARRYEITLGKALKSSLDARQHPRQAAGSLAAAVEGGFALARDAGTNLT